MASTSVAAPSSTPVSNNSTASAPLTEITPTNHTGIIIITNALGMILILIFLVIRISVRLYLSPPFDMDDWLLFAATAFCIIYYSLVFELVSEGFGKVLDTIDPSNLVSLQKAAYASDFFYLITLCLSKCSMSSVYIRLSPDKRLVRVAKGVFVASAVWLVASMLMIALRCDLSHPWIFVNAKCTNVLLRWQIISAFDIAIEVALFAMSILLVKDLKMRFRRKAYVIAAFSLRLPIIAAIVLRLHSLSVETHSSDPTFAGIFFIIWSIVEVAFGICSGNIACLKPFVAAFNTSYGGSVEINALERGTGKGSYSGDLRTKSSMTYPQRRAARRQHNESKSGSTGVTINSRTEEDYNVDKIAALETTPKSNQKKKYNEITPNPLADAGIGAKHVNNVEISHGDADSTWSDGSRQMIIRQEMGWSVESGDEPH